MTIKIPVGLSRIFTADPKDGDGNPALVDGSIGYTLEQFPIVAHLEPVSALAVKVVGDSPGSCVLRGEADVLVGPGLVTRVETVAIEIVEIAETLNIAAGDVQVPE